MMERVLTDTETEVFDGSPPLEEGETVVPGYEVIEHLHRSNSFDVYDVFSEERACRCIVKTPISDRLGDEKLEHDLVREGTLLKELTHPHIVRAYDIVESPVPAVILETLTGETLSHLIEARKRRLPVADVAYLGLHLCSALHYLHSKRILHLDLKPSNIVSERGLAKILDLSIASSPGPGRRGVGTPQYMAPEQALGEYLSPATDVWGLGAVLFEATTGKMPFNDGQEGEDGDEYEQLKVRAAPVRTHRRVPVKLASIVAACLEPTVEDRCTLSELESVLTSLASSLN